MSSGSIASVVRHLRPYPQYGCLDDPWLDRIPSNWSFSKLGAVASVKARLGWKGLKASEYVDEGFVFLSTPNIKGPRIDFDNVDYITAQRYHESPEIMLRNGDVLIAKDGSTLGIANVVRSLPAPATVNSSIAVIRPATKLNSVYCFYFFTSHYTQSMIGRMKDGMGVPHLFQADLRKFTILLPSEDEQAAIAEFLDRETARIDALIERKEQLITLLEEKRAALINHAVTNGLDPSAPMRDSGIPWLGAIPGHWRVKRLKFVLLGIEQGWSPDCEARLADEGEWGVLKVGCVNGAFFDEREHKVLPSAETPIPALEVRPGDILMSRANTRELLGSAALVRSVRRRLLLCDKLYRLRPQPKEVINEFLVYALRSRMARFQYERDATGASSSMQNIGQTSVREMVLPVPPSTEQQRIVDFIDATTPKLDTIIAKTREQIAKFWEYRTALISAAVTGKIDVRGSAQV